MQQQSRGKWLMIGGSVAIVAILVGILQMDKVGGWFRKEKPAEVAAPKTAQAENNDESAYQMVIKGRLKEVQACYNAELKKGLSIRAGKLVVKWTVGPEGKSSDFSEEINEMNSSELYECATRAISAWPFPKNKTFMIRYTFKMREIEKTKTAGTGSGGDGSPAAPSRKTAGQTAPEPLTEDVRSQLGEM